MSTRLQKSSSTWWKETTVSKEYIDYLTSRKRNLEKFPPPLTWENTKIYLAQKKKETTIVPFKP
ncbi:hypothetical protein HanRHA438_Chr11g0493891 [Helianthus annuus]|nr:hypothetical protein HanOQP8_Chr11g0396931 [Helianthus annuus]KAJ0869873.1 hypothetical protein HanRHA438_Chr11g0493891 [Helianthus annuus]